MCRFCGVRSGFVLLMNLTYNFGETSDLPRGLLDMPLMCDVSGPVLDDCSKNGKKAAEAMSLSKEGKFVCYHLQDIIRNIRLLFGTFKTKNLYCVNG